MSRSRLLRLLNLPPNRLLTPERAAAFEGETVALAAPTMIGDLLAPSCGMRSVTTFVQGPSIFVPGTPGTPAVQGISGSCHRESLKWTDYSITTQPTPGTPATPWNSRFHNSERPGARHHHDFCALGKP